MIANSVLYYNNVLHYEVAEDAMKTDELSEVAEMAELADRAIRLIRSMTIIFIFISPLPRVHFCLKKVWRNPKRAPPVVGTTPARCARLRPAWVRLIVVLVPH